MHETTLHPFSYKARAKVGMGFICDCLTLTGEEAPLLYDVQSTIDISLCLSVFRV